jgi:flagellar protein FliL
VTDRIPLSCWRRLVLAAALLAALAAALPAMAAEGEKAEPKSTSGAPIFFNIHPIVLPVVVGNSIPRQVGILLTVELGEGHAQSEVRAKDRQLTDAFITELYRIYGWRSGDTHVVNERLIKDRLQIVANRVLGKGVVDAILIRQLIEQER